MRNSDGGETWAVLECPWTNFSDAIWYGNRGEACAARECPLVNLSYTIRNGIRYKI